MRKHLDLTQDLATSIKSCFALFGKIHEINNSTETLKLVTNDVIDEFVIDDNVKVLELRSSLKPIPDLRSYISVVDDCIKTKRNQFDSLISFLPSLNRSKSFQTAEETVKLAAEYNCPGLDLSDSPLKGDMKKLAPLLTYAKKFHGLKLALHCAEFDLPDEKDTEILLYDVPIDRIGHGTFISKNKTFVDHVLAEKIPIECCLTSNLVSQTCKDFKSHHFKFWYDQSHPVSICTDDKGVFETTLNQEYEIVKDTFDLDIPDLVKISKSSIQQSFFDQNDKKSVVEKYF